MIRQTYEWCGRVYERLKFRRDGSERLHGEKTPEGLTDFHTFDPALAAELDAAGVTFESLWQRSLEHMEWLVKAFAASRSEPGL